MNKKELYKDISEETQVDRVVVETVIESYLDNMSRNIAAGSEFKIGKIGNLRIASYKGRTVKPPKGETVTTPGGKTVRFRVFKSFKDQLN